MLRAVLSASASLAALTACNLPVRPIHPANSTESGANSLSSGALAAAESKAEVPLPPERAPAPPVAPVNHFKLVDGPDVCLAERPDFSRTFIALELNAQLAPERLLLLREWLVEEWSRRAPTVAFRWFPEECSASLVCASLDPSATHTAAHALAGALARPGGTTFYGVRAKALDQAEDWDRNNAEWKLHAFTHSVFGDSKKVATLRAAPDPVPNEIYVSTLQKESGHALATRVTMYELTEALVEARDASQITVLGPGQPEVSRDQLIQAWSPLKAGPKPKAQRTAVSSPPAPLLVEEHAAELSQAAFIWQPTTPGEASSLPIMFTLLVERWRREDTSDVRARVEVAHGLYSLPSIRLEGPHDQVLAAISGLSTELDRLISAQGPPSENEWRAASLKSPRSGQPEPRCAPFSSNDLTPAAVRGALESLRILGSPAVVVWGNPNPPATSE